MKTNIYKIKNRKIKMRKLSSLTGIHLKNLEQNFIHWIKKADGMIEEQETLKSSTSVINNTK